MSGPKSSRYTLTAAQRRAIEEQRRIEQERKENCIWVKNMLGQIQKENSTFVREQAVAKELTAKTGNDHGLQRLIQEMQETVTSAVALAQNVESKDAAHVKVICTQIKQRQAEIALLQQKIRQAAQENDEALGRYFGVSIADAFSAKNDVSDTPAEEITDSSENLKAKICAELTKVLDAQPKISDDLFARGEQAKSALEKLQDEEHLKNFAAITVIPLLADSKKKSLRMRGFLRCTHRPGLAMKLCVCPQRLSQKKCAAVRQGWKCCKKRSRGSNSSLQRTMNEPTSARALTK